MILVGIHGAAGAGKDTFAEALIRGTHWEDRAFAGPLYEAVAVITRMPVSWLKNRENKERIIPWIGKSPRELLQLLGTDFGRNMVRDDFWIQLAMQPPTNPESTGIVYTDVRFDNEAEAIISRGGVIFEVVRAGSSCLTGGTSTHPSETPLSRHLIFETIRNDGTLDDLWTAAESARVRLLDNIMSV